MAQEKPVEALSTLYLARTCQPSDPFVDPDREVPQGDDYRSAEEIRDSLIAVLEDNLGASLANQMKTLAVQYEWECCAQTTSSATTLSPPDSRGEERGGRQAWRYSAASFWWKMGSTWASSRSGMWHLMTWPSPTSWLGGSCSSQSLPR